MQHSASGNFNASGSMAFSVGSASFRNDPTSKIATTNKKKANLVRSQYFRPHTPSICNRKNDTEEMKLQYEIQRQQTEQRSGTPRALPWAPQSPRFKPKPPQCTSENVAPCCDIGSETYFQDRPCPSNRSKICTAFRAPSRDGAAPVSATRSGRIPTSEENEVLGQIRRLENLCRSREELRHFKATQLADAEEAVMAEFRPEKATITPRRSFREFEEEMKAYQEAAEWLNQKDKAEKKKQQQQQKTMENEESESDNDDDDDENLDQTQRPVNKNKIKQQKEQEEESEKENEQQQQQEEENNNNNSVPPQDSHLQKFYYDRLSSYEAVRKLQQTAAGVLSARTKAGSTALRIRDQYSNQAADRTSFSHLNEPRSRTVRMIDPSLESSNSARARYRSASESEIEALVNGGGGADGSGAAFGDVSARGRGSIGASAGYVGHQYNQSGGGNWCRQAFYDVPVEAFKHTPTPRLTPRTHSANAVKRQIQLRESGVTTTSGKIRLQLEKKHQMERQNRALAESEQQQHVEITEAEMKKRALKAAVAAALAKRKKEANAMLASYTLVDAPLLSSRTSRPKRKKATVVVDENGVEKTVYQETSRYEDVDEDEFNRMFLQVDPHLSCGVSFERQTGRERRPLSAGMASHTGFSAGLSVDTLQRGDSASGKIHNMGCIPMKLPLHEKRPPPQTKLQCFPKYGYVHNRPPSVTFGSPPRPRSPIILGDPERIGDLGKNIPEKVDPPIRTLGGPMIMNVVFDCRESLRNIHKGVELTHPKSIRDIKMPILKRKQNEDEENMIASVEGSVAGGN